ncbi:regulatory protein RecX [Streptomyces sp. NPDC005438]|uniref:regulatory protein RecX n=1 Tax=Streptomyces sp. NPDC005438 TaxID=3156880 RepID=UPI0033AD2CAD
MTRRSTWPGPEAAGADEDGGDPASSRAGVGSPRIKGGRRAPNSRSSGTGSAPFGDGTDEMGQASTASPEQRARALCLRLLTGSPKTRAQLAEAMRRKEIPDEVAETVLARFEEAGMIDDDAFADAWVESRHHSKGLARRALARELRTKGLESEVIEAAVSQLDTDQEVRTARALVERKLRSTRGLDRQRRIRRLAGLLARKGYGEDLSRRVIREAMEAEAAEDPEASSGQQAEEDWEL